MLQAFFTQIRRMFAEAIVGGAHDAFKELGAPVVIVQVKEDESPALPPNGNGRKARIANALKDDK